MAKERDTLVQNLTDSTIAFMRAWKSSMITILEDHDISPAQAGILMFLNEHAPISGKEIAAKMHISPSAVTQMLDALDKAGYLVRQADEQDRRINYLSLSKLGNKRVKQFQKIRNEFFADLASSLSDEELKLLTKIQNKMVDHIES